MSDKDGYSAELDTANLERLAEQRDKYLQQLIERLDDPEYEYYPVLIDNEMLYMPPGHSLEQIKNGLKHALKIIKTLIRRE